MISVSFEISAIAPSPMMVLKLDHYILGKCLSGQPRKQANHVESLIFRELGGDLLLAQLKDGGRIPAD